MTATRPKTPRALLRLPLAVLLPFVLPAACASDEAAEKPGAPSVPARTQAPAEPEEPAQRWSAELDVAATRRPWSELPAAPEALPAARDLQRDRLRGRELRSVRELEPGDRMLDLPPAHGCRVLYRERSLDPDLKLLQIYPRLAASFTLVCDGQAHHLAGAVCDDAMARPADDRPRTPRHDVDSAVETAVALERASVGDGLLLAARRAGGRDPRAVLLELAKRAPRSECLTQLVDLPLIERAVRVQEQRVDEARPAQPMLQRVARLEAKARSGLALLPDEKKELAFLRERLASEPELQRAPPALVAQLRRPHAVARGVRDVHARLLRERGRAPTWPELRAAARGDGSLRAAVRALPADDRVRALMTSWLRSEAHGLSPFVRARLDGQIGYRSIVAPTRLPDDEERSADPAGAERAENVCGACRDSRECAGELLCSNAFTGEETGHCTQLVDGDEDRPGCTKAWEIDRPRLPVAGADGEPLYGYLCEPAPGCEARNAARAGTKCQSPAESTADEDPFATRSYGCGERGVCVAEGAVCGVPCGADGACPTGLRCEELAVTRARVQGELPARRGRVCVAPDADRRPYLEWEAARSRARLVDLDRTLRAAGAALENRVTGGFDGRVEDGALRTGATWGGLTARGLRFFALDPAGRCVVAAAEERASTKAAEGAELAFSAPPVLWHRRVQASVTCDGRTFAPLVAHVCRTVSRDGAHEAGEAALLPIVVEARDVHYAPLEAVARTYEESLLEARGRVTRNSYDETCFSPVLPSVADLVRDVQERDTRNLGAPDRPLLWPRYAGWMSTPYFAALAAGEDTTEFEQEAGPHFVRPDELDRADRLGAGGEGTRRHFEAFFAERAANAAFVKAVLDGEEPAWTGRAEADAARAAMVLALGPRLPGVPPPGEATSAEADAGRRSQRLRAWRALPVVRESAARLRAWAGTLSDEDRVAVGYALDALAADTRPVERPLRRLEGALSARPSSSPIVAGTIAVSPHDVVCDLGRRWADDERWTWEPFVDHRPHWYKRTRWASLLETARERGVEVAGAGGVLCERHFAHERRSLSDVEARRFGELEAKRLGDFPLTQGERVRLGELGSRFAWAQPDAAARLVARDALVKAHGELPPLTEPELAKLAQLHRDVAYENPVYSFKEEQYRNLRLRFVTTSEQSLDDLVRARMTPAEARAFDRNLACLRDVARVRAVAHPIHDALSLRSFDNAPYPESLGDLGDLGEVDTTGLALGVEQHGKVRITPEPGSGMDPRAAWLVDDFTELEWVGDERARCASVYEAATDPTQRVK